MPNKGTSTKVPRVCEMCRTNFLALPSAIKRGGGKFCSSPCKHASHVRPTEGMWTCTWCSKQKPVDEFNKRGQVCRACFNAKMREKYATDPAFAATRNLYDRRAYANDPAKKLAYTRAYAKAHPEKVIKSIKRYQADNPEKVAAHRAVARARSAKILIRQACEECGNPVSYAHHHLGYAPEHHLDVQWLCRTHHIRAHKS